MFINNKLNRDRYTYFNKRRKVAGQIIDDEGCIYLDAKYESELKIKNKFSQTDIDAAISEKLKDAK